MPTKEESKEIAGYTRGPMSPIEQEVARGLRFSHIMCLAILRHENESVRLIEALKKLLVAKNITSEAEWADALDNPTHIPPEFLLDIS
jgi:hypothetical protein